MKRTGEKFTSIVNCERRWNALCSLLDDNQYWNLLTSQISKEGLEYAQLLDGNASNPWNSSRELLLHWKNDSNATTSKLLEILSTINHNEAISLIQSWIHEDSSQITQSPSKKMKTTIQTSPEAQQLFEQAMNFFLREMMDKAIPLFEKVIEDTNYPAAMLTLRRIGRSRVEKEAWKYRCLDHKDWFIEQTLTGDAAADYRMGCYLEDIEDNFEEALPWYQKAAEKNYGPALNCMACLYLAGQGVQQNSVTAFQLMERAANQGHITAQINLGVMFRDGKGTAKNIDLAAVWLAKAFEQGHINAAFELAVGYEKEGMFEQAAKWYQKAADCGLAKAQCNLGACYVNAQGVPKDYEKGAYWYERAAEQGDVIAIHNIGLHYLDGNGVTQDLKKAASWFEAGAKLDSATCQYLLAKCYVEGKGVNRDDAMAAYWLDEAATNGSAPAMFLLGIFYMDGKGVERDHKKAVKYYRKATKLNYLAAQYNLAYCYYNGLGVEKNLSQSFKMFLQLAEEGHIKKAQCDVGLMYLNGEGTAKDASLGVEWLRKAAQSNNSKAQFYLGDCYYYGRGVKVDFGQAVYWYQKAADKKYNHAIKALARCYEYGEGVAQDLDKAMDLLENGEMYGSSILLRLYEVTSMRHYRKEEAEY